MTYSRSGDHVTLQLSFEEYRQLLQTLQIAESSSADRMLDAYLSRVIGFLHSATPRLDLDALLPEGSVPEPE